jgi:hypothetical protein
MIHSNIPICQVEFPDNQDIAKINKMETYLPEQKKYLKIILERANYETKNPHFVRSQCLAVAIILP